MCRLSNFPPGFSRNEALKILLEMEKNNKDGVGNCYIKDGEFVVEKYPFSLTGVLEEGIPFLSHMPCNSHTLVHLRNATHGGNFIKNCHPFITKNYALIHNGVWHEHDLARAFLEKLNIEMNGETDSQVAAETIEFLGPKKFSEIIDYGGVFIVLHKSGELYVIKSSGQLELFYSKNKRVLISSELSYKDYPKSLVAMNGLYKFNKNGKFISHKPSQTFITNQYDWLTKSKNNSRVKILPAKIPFHYNLPSYYQNFVD